MINYFEYDKNGVILGYGAGEKLPTGNYKEVTKNRIATGENINHYDKDGIKLPLSQLVSKGFVKLQHTQKLDGEKVINKTEVELIEEGLKENPKGMKIENGELVAMTLKEQFEASEITEEEYAETIKQQRNSKLAEMDKYSIMHMEGALTDEQYKKVKKHKDYLRGIPQSKGFPETFTDFEEFTL